MNRAPGGVTYGTNMPPELMQNHPYGRLPYGQQSMGMYTQNQPLPPGELPTCFLIIFTFCRASSMNSAKTWVWIICPSTGGPGLEPPYRPARNPQMNKMMTTRPSYPGMMPGIQGSMPGMMGLDKQYPMGYKPQPNMPQGQILRQQLQVRLVSRLGGFS